MFPFGRDSTVAKSVIQYLHDNHNYQTRITDGGTYQKNVFSNRESKTKSRLQFILSKISFL